MQLDYLNFANEVLLIDVSVMQQFVLAELACLESGLPNKMNLELSYENQVICVCQLPENLTNLDCRHLFFQVKLPLI